MSRPMRPVTIANRALALAEVAIIGAGPATWLMHRFPDDGPFERAMQVAALDHIASSRAARTAIAENHVGLPNWGLGLCHVACTKGARWERMMEKVKAGIATTLTAATAIATGAVAQPAALASTLEYAFPATVELGQGDGGRKRFIAITGGKIDGPLLTGEVLPGGGDRQVIENDGLTRIEARYFLEARDGTVIEVTNPGVRVATPEVIDRLARGERGSCLELFSYDAALFGKGREIGLVARSAFLARGVRRPDEVVIDFYVVR